MAKTWNIYYCSQENSGVTDGVSGLSLVSLTHLQQDIDLLDSSPDLGGVFIWGFSQIFNSLAAQARCLSPV